MNDFLHNGPVMTILAVVVAIIGGVIAILHPETLSFEAYCKNVGFFIGGVGVLGIGRGVAARKS